MKRCLPSLRQLGFAGLWLCFWGAVILGFSAQVVSASSLTWVQALQFTARDWLPWIALSPAVFALTRWLPLERRTLHLIIPVYLLAGAAMVTSAGLASEWISTLKPFEIDAEIEGGRPFPSDRPPDRPPHLRDGPPGGRGGPPPFGGRGRRGGGPPVWVRARFHGPVFLMLVSLGTAFSHYRLSQDRERKTAELASRLAQAKLQALRLQLQPHFLFNALNAIATLVHKDPHRADDMIANLSDLLRASLETTAQEIPLRQELKILDHYLEMERMRLGDRLIVRNQLRSETLELLVPPLILQPIAENAVRHGIEPRLAAGTLTLESFRLKDRLVIRVADDGKGIQPKTGGEAREGIGLANTRARLEELYGSRAAVSIESSPETGTVVQLEIPVTTASA